MNLENDPGQRTSFVARMLVRQADLVCRFPYPTLVLTLGLAGVSAYLFCADLKCYTSRNDLISPNKDYLQRWKQYVAEFGKDDDVVVVVEGNDTDRDEASPRKHRLRSAQAAGVIRSALL